MLHSACFLLRMSFFPNPQSPGSSAFKFKAEMGLLKECEGLMRGSALRPQCKPQWAAMAHLPILASSSHDVAKHQHPSDPLHPFAISPHSRSPSLHHIINGYQHNTTFQWFPAPVNALISRLNPHKNFSGYLTSKHTSVTLSVTTTSLGANASARVSNLLAATQAPLQCRVTMMMVARWPTTTAVT